MHQWHVTLDAKEMNYQQLYFLAKTVAETKLNLNLHA